MTDSVDIPTTNPGFLTMTSSVKISVKPVCLSTLAIRRLSPKTATVAEFGLSDCDN